MIRLVDFSGDTFVVLLVFQPIILILLDIPPMLPVLDGVVMELQDCALPLLRGEPSVCVNVCLYHEGLTTQRCLLNKN